MPVPDVVTVGVSAVNRSIRVTEQGEMIQNKFGIPEIAARSLELYTSSSLLATLSPVRPVKASWRARMDALSASAVKTFRAHIKEDPRFVDYFRSVTPESELAELSIEVSLLGPLEPVSSSAEVEIGRHGLVIERGRRRGLLLPQVACEWGWDAETFLAQTCRKAGLPLDAWRSGARIWRFEAEVFGDTG